MWINIRLHSNIVLSTLPRFSSSALISMIRSHRSLAETGGVDLCFQEIKRARKEAIRYSRSRHVWRQVSAVFTELGDRNR